MARIGTRRATLGLESLRWQAVVGTLQVSSGALQAATMGDWGLNKCVNPEFTTDTTGWIAPAGLDASRVDSEADPGANSGGADKWAAKIVKTSTAADRQYSYVISAVIGAKYAARVRSYSPSANTQTYAARLFMFASSGWNASGSQTTATEDAWTPLTCSSVATAATAYIWNGIIGTTPGDLVYFDAASTYRQNSLSLLRGWVSPDFEATLAHISPASAVTPFGFVCRYTDASNYWEVRILPNTAGNDLQIIQVTAGAETVRAEGDIDWTAGDTDYIRITAKGSTISTAHMKHGAGSYTAGPSYASASQGQTSPKLGVMLYETGVSRLGSLEVRRA